MSASDKFRTALVLAPGSPAAAGVERRALDSRAELDSPRPVARSQTGWLFPLALVGAGGLLLVSIAFTIARSHPGSGTAQLIFWLGLGTIVLPVAARLFGARAGRGERAGLLLLVGILLYAVKVIHDPYGFTFADEWVHVANVQQILHTGKLFNGSNPIIPVTSRYPGLEVVTAAVSSLTHLSVFASGVVLVGACRVLFVLSFFFLAESLLGSARVASAAGILYMTNPNFLYWSADFSYESIALPLALFAVVAALRLRAVPRAGRVPASHRLSRSPRAAERGAWSVVALLAIAATVMSHHLTSYALAVALVLACAVALLRPGTRRNAPWLPAAAAVALCAVWAFEVAPGTGQYLVPVLGGAFHETVATILGHSTGRSLFGGSTSGQPAAEQWQRYVALASVGLIALVLPFGLLDVRRRFRRDPFVLVFAAAAVAYIAVLPMRLVPDAWETSNRSSEFLFVGVALTVALGLLRGRLGSRARAWAAAAFMAVLLIGGIVAGWPPRDLLALPERARAAGGATIVPQPQAVAVWSRAVLGPGNRFIAPEAVGRELLVNGGQVAYVSSAPFGAQSVLFGDTMTSGIVDTIAEHQIDYVAEASLVAGNDNMTGYFFDSPGEEQQVGALTRAKFGTYPGVDRVLDSGEIAVYDVREFLGAP